MEPVKICTKCKQSKSFNEFYGKNYWCKKCQIQQIMQKRKQNPESYQRYIKDTWNQPNMIFSRKKANAKSERISFSIEKKQFIEWYNQQPLECHYCNLSPENFKETADKILLNKINLGIDRIDNNKGYEFGNIVLCCNRCNTLKSGFFNYEEMKIIGRKFVKTKWRKNGIRYKH